MKSKTKRLGVIGGLSPRTSSSFCLQVNDKIIAKTNCQPNMVIEHLPVSLETEKEIINGKNPIQMKLLLLEAIKRLNSAESDLIVIPCNTVHVFIKELRKASKVPVLSIIEECAKECKQKGFSKVGLLATTKSVKEGLHMKELTKAKIQLILPSKENQAIICKIIQRIIHNKAGKKDEMFLHKTIFNLRLRGAKAVILGCTDFQHILTNEKSELPLIDTCEVLEDAVVQQLTIPA